MSSAQVTPKATEEVSKSLLDQIAEQQAHFATRYMPTLTVKQFSDREKMLRELKELLVEGTDYGTIPGTQKPTLYKPGAEKICAFMGYAPKYHEHVESIEDWTGEKFGEPLFYYKYTCSLEKDGKHVGEGSGSSNSWESKYRYRWVKQHDIPHNLTQEQIDDLPIRDGSISEPAFAVDKAETSGPYGKPAEYWQKFKDAIAAGTAVKIKKTTKAGKPMDAWEISDMLYRVPNPDFPDLINTCQKMGQKRAYIAATLSATGASQYFTQDMEDTVPEESPEEMGKRRVAEESAKQDAKKSTAAPPTQQEPPAPPPNPLEGVPEELHAIISNLAKPGGLALGVKMVKETLLLAHPINGEAEWEMLLGKHGIKKTGSNSESKIRALLLEAFDKATNVKEEKPAEEKPPFEATDADLPADLFSDAKEPA